MQAANRLSSGLLSRARGRSGDPGGPGATAAGRPARVAAVAVVVLAAVLFPAFEGGNITIMGLATEVLSYGLVTLALNLLMGYGGQVSIGHGGLLAVGAYTTAIVGTRFHPPFIVILLLAGLVTALIGFLLGLPAGRLRSHYLAVVTLGFGVAVPEIALNLGSLTGGFTGLIIPPESVGGIGLNSPVPLYYLALGLLVLAMAAMSSILASPTGRRFMAVRDSEQTAPAMGINVRVTKLMLFSISAFFSGLAGYVFALNNGIVEPDSFGFSLSLFFFAAVVVGGLASTWGAVLGAALLVIVQQETASTGGLSEVILGAAVVLVLLVAPGGLAALPRDAYRLAGRSRPGRSAPAPLEAPPTRTRAEG
jgi:branched-chain amino acid transport system permease protein